MNQGRRRHHMPHPGGPAPGHRAHRAAQINEFDTSSTTCCPPTESNPQGRTMPEHPPSFWRDPLFSPGDRFPLGPPRGILSNCHEGPSGPETRPFSLRHVVAGSRLDTLPTARYTYCHERQIALVHDEDGSLIPLLRHTRPGPTPEQKSGLDPDGQRPGEEVGAPDWQPD